MSDEITTMKVRKSTTVLLRTIAKHRGRRESLEQVVLELIDQYTKMLKREATTRE